MAENRKGHERRAEMRKVSAKSRMEEILGRPQGMFCESMEVH